MLRAGATALIGLGVTLASTFASSLGLSLAQQRFGFFAGILITLIGCGAFLLSIKRAHRKFPIKAYKTHPLAPPVQHTALSTALTKALRDDLYAGRQLLAPLSVPEYAMSSNDGSHLRIGNTERDIRDWTQGVRGRIEVETPELLAVFDHGVDLPAPIMMIGLSLDQFVNRSQLVRFLEAKLRNLERIIAAQPELSGSVGVSNSLPSA